MIDTDRLSQTLRARLLEPKSRSIRFTNFEGTEQALDISKPLNCQGFGRIHRFRRNADPDWPENPLPIGPASARLGLPRVDVLDAEVFQTAGCNWRCWYCYVPFNLLAADDRFSELVPVDRLIRMYATLPGRPPVLDLSGGQPDLTPELVPWTLEAINDQGLSDAVYLWSDDNLSNDYFWRYLTEQQRETMASTRNYGRVCCFKGFDSASFAFNTSASPELFERQFVLMRRMLASGVDVYCYATFTTPIIDEMAGKMRTFVDRLQQLDERLPLRTVPLRIRSYTPTRRRVNKDRDRALNAQRAAIAAWTDELSRRFSIDERRISMHDVHLGS